MTLEEHLREGCAKGLTHLSLYPVPSADGKTTYWHATASPSTQHQYVKHTCLDPVEVVAQVLQLLPRATRRVTATVKPKFDSVNPPLSEFPQRAAQMAAEAGVKLEEQPTKAGSLEDWMK